MSWKTYRYFGGIEGIRGTNVKTSRYFLVESDNPGQLAKITGENGATSAKREFAQKVTGEFRLNW